ncbi:MAG: HdeD family acid-resistance protein [Bacteroidales bacterium]
MNDSATTPKTAKHWYLTLISGLILAAIGLWSLFSPLKAYLALAIFFSASLLFTGLLEIIFAIANRKHMHNWGWTLILGGITFLIGIMLTSNPAITVVTLPLYIGFTFLIRSFGTIAFALDLKSFGERWGAMMVIGILGIIVSFMLIRHPIFAGMTVVVWTGLTFLVSGIFSIYMSFKIKKFEKLSKEDFA